MTQQNTNTPVPEQEQEREKPVRSRPVTQSKDIGSSILVLILLLAGIGAFLEYFGVINVSPSFGRGGRPQLELGLWQGAEFSDVPENFWASPFIEELVQRNVISGYPNNEFRPEEAVTRGAFAAMVESAFEIEAAPDATEFSDVPADYWATDAIAATTASNFLAGYPDNEFQPQEPLSRVNAIVAIANGLNLTPEGDPEQILQANYLDASEIPDYAREAVAAATEAGLVANHPDSNWLDPNEAATRADVTAFIYQALVQQGRAGRIRSPYIVNQI